MPTNEEQAVRFLATLRELDPPDYIHVISAVLILRESDDVEALRLAGKAILRNLQRLEDALDEAKSKASS
jgi:hypothetical protein